MKVKSEKKEKSQALGYILSLAAMAAMVALFAAAVLNFSGRTGAREEETLRKGQGLRSSARPLRAVIRPAWNIWRRITRSRLTERNTMCFTMVSRPM